MAKLTPETVKRMAEIRLIQTFRQYPRAARHLTISCRERLLAAIRKGILEPDALRKHIVRSPDEWTLQARLAFNDLFGIYQDNFVAGADAENTALLRAIGNGIFSAGRIAL